MAYASASTVSGLCKNLLGGEPTFTTSTCPTVYEVNQWLSSGCSIIESTLASCRYTVPVSAGATIYDWIVSLNALYAAAFAELSRTNVTLSNQERTRGQVMLETFEKQLDRLCDGDLTQAGLSRSANGKLYAGGISVADKQSQESTSDRVNPRFGREMFTFPDSLNPNPTTAS
jgi:hypothetical protein